MDISAGASLAVPEGYTGSLLRKQDEGGDQEPSWQAEARFTAVSYWNHDTHTAKMDGAQRCFEWLALARAVRQNCDRPRAVCLEP